VERKNKMMMLSPKAIEYDCETGRFAERRIKF
jgi:hypothetical protein